MADTRTVTCSAPVNIAVIKYCKWWHDTRKLTCPFEAASCLLETYVSQ